jgi:hypothetical protein
VEEEVEEGAVEEVAKWWREGSIALRYSFLVPIVVQC